MALIRIVESDDWFVDYDRESGMYRVTYFEDNHFVDECWFDAYEEKEVEIKDISQPIKKFEKYVDDNVWWCGYCPKCGQMLNYNHADEDRDNRKQHCWKCGQLVEFK